MDSDLDLGDNLHMRALVRGDALLLTEATSGELAPALWGASSGGALLAARRPDGAIGVGSRRQAASSPSESCATASFSAPWG